MKSLYIIIFAFIINCLAHPQGVNYVRGKVVYISENNVETPQQGITVLIENTGDRDKTDQNGIFKIFLNKIFKLGDKITFDVEKKDWAIRDPLFGKTYIPSNRQNEIIKLSVLPKGSPLFFTDQQITRYIEYLILKQSSVQAISKIDYSKLTLESLLDTMAINWGFSIPEIESAFHKWIKKTVHDTSKYYERGLAEYAQNNFDLAGDLFKKSANIRIKHFRIVEKDYKNLSKERKTLIDETSRDLRLSAESYFEVNNYDSSIIAYKKAIEFVNYAEDWETLANTFNRIATCYYYLSFTTIDEGAFQQLDSANFYWGKGLNLTREKSLDDWKWKFRGNLATLVAERETISKSSDKSAQLLNTIKNLKSVIDNRQNEEDERDKFLGINNIGVCYDLLYEFTENLDEAEQYLDSAGFCYTKLINDSSYKADYQFEWSYAVYNFALTSLDIGINKYLLPSHFEMLALRIRNFSDNNYTEYGSQKIDSSYIGLLYHVYLNILGVENIIEKEKKPLELASILNSITWIRIQLMIYDDYYLNQNFIQTTDSIISVTEDLARRTNIFRAMLFVQGNKAILELLNSLYHKTISEDEIIHSNDTIEHLLKHNRILKLYEAYLKRIMMLNYFFLSNASFDQLQKNTYRNRYFELNNEIIENYKELGYIREVEEAIRIREIFEN